MNKALKQAVKDLDRTAWVDPPADRADQFFKDNSQDIFEHLVNESARTMKPVVDMIAELPGVNYDRYDVLNMIQGGTAEIQKEIRIAVARYIIGRAI